MNAIVNFGNPRKDMTVVADAVLGTYSCSNLKITGVEIYRKENMFLTSATYGAGMTLDTLVELKTEGLLERGDKIVFVGSMGSLNENEISLEDVVIPNPSGCAYYGFEEQWLRQDELLLNSLKDVLTTSKVRYREYKHGSSFAVYDPHTNHTTYTTSLYTNEVIGLDCGEVFLGLQFARDNELRATSVLYCSDSPNVHIGDIGTEDFGKRAIETDILLNRVGSHVLQLNREE